MNHNKVGEVEIQDQEGVAGNDNPKANGAKEKPEFNENPGFLVEGTRYTLVGSRSFFRFNKLVARQVCTSNHCGD